MLSTSEGIIPFVEVDRFPFRGERGIGKVPLIFFLGENKVSSDEYTGKHKRYNP